MKKAVSMLLAVIMTISLGSVAFANSFSDLAKEHWAYQNVMTLVEEGTVNGYEDGTFRPSKTVTRAEFVKMIGKWDRKYEGTFSDLASNHWGYEYIMWSGLEPDGTKIYPDKEMLRSDVINLIWKRNGSPKHDDAPYAISNQGTNKDATSWAYTIGLIQGDDGFHLRLDSALTRAEAATLILRARTVVAENKKYNFKDVVDEKILKEIYRSTNLFDGEYAPDRKVTYGEMARASLKLVASGKNVNLVDADPTKMIQHKFSAEMYLLSENLWGMRYNTVKKAEEKVTVQDALSALVYGLVKRSGRTVNVGAQDDWFVDCVDAKSTTMENMCLTYAKQEGIKLNAGTKLGAQNLVTMKDIALMLLQLNESAGLQISFNANGHKYNAKANMNFAEYPANYKDYAAVLEDVPTKVYNVKNETTKPNDFFMIANECYFIFTGFLDAVETKVKQESGAIVSLTYYPTLTYQENGKVTFIVKANIEKNETNANADVCFKSFLNEKTEIAMPQGAEVFLVFETYEPLMDIYLPVSGAALKEIITLN